MTFQEVRDFAFKAWDDNQRHAAISALQDFIAATPHTDMRCQAWELLLPYLEATRRVGRGLSDYSADDANEAPFMFCADELHTYDALAQAWGSPLARSKAKLAIGAYSEIDALLDLARWPSVDARIANAHFQGPWFDNVEKSAYTMIGDIPSVYWERNNPCERRVFFACDWAFYEQYGERLHRSYNASGSPARLHIHLFNAPRVWGFDQHANVSHETIELGRDAKLYYAAIRLVRLWELMERSPCPTIMLDADLFAGGNMDEMFDRLSRVDVAICKMPGRLQYHTQANASVLGIGVGGLPYLKRIAGYIAKVFMEGRPCWCLDQIAIHGTLREMQSRSVAPAVVAWGPGVYDGTYAALLKPQKVAEHSPDYAQWQRMNERFSA